VRKLAPDLTPVAELSADVAEPKAFHVPFVTLRDHRAGTVTRVGQPSGLSIDRWSDASGMRRWGLGLDVSHLELIGDAAPSARFTLTDQALVSLELVDAASGRSITRRAVGTLPAGIHTIPLADADLHAAASVGSARVRVSAVSSYPGGATASALASRSLGGSTSGTGASRMLANSPNPVQSWTRIRFVLSSGDAAPVLRLYDASGRLVRSFPARFAPGLNEVVWDGTDDGGRPLPAGVYLSRLVVGAKAYDHKMVLAR
jgi:hypothetical protein